MLRPPAQNVDRALWRAVLEAAAGFSPVTAAIARIYQVTFPPKFEQDLAVWRADLATAVNDHEGRLSQLEAHRPQLKLSPDGVALATWLAAQSPDGLETSIGYGDVKASFPEATDRELQDAAAELELYGLAEVGKALGHPVRLIQPRNALFALFDPLVLGTSPQRDAVAVAQSVLDLDSGDARELEGHLGWPRRRFNPAFALVLGLVGQGRVRQVIQADYPSIGFLPSADERVRFRALIEAVRPPV